jgi:Fe2+ or Zn2+ uptake regulation protein
MSLSPHTSTPCTASDTDLRQALECAGWRYTRQRAAVFAFLRTATGHPTAEQVFAAVRREIPNISLATVYKALEALVDCKLAARLTDDDGTSRYDGRSDAHYHLRCLETGRVCDLPIPYDPELLDKVAPVLRDWLREQGFELTGHRLEIIGHFRTEK